MFVYLGSTRPCWTTRKPWSSGKNALAYPQNIGPIISRFNLVKIVVFYSQWTISLLDKLLNWAYSLAYIHKEFPKFSKRNLITLFRA